MAGRNKISLAGELGSGKSTVSALLKDKIGAEIYSTGSIVRTVAARRGMSVTELNVYMETHPEIDREIDDGLVELSNDPRTLIIDSRMAWHFTKDTFRVYLTTDPKEAAARIMAANREGEHAATLEETLAETKKRRNSERKRYFEKYGQDVKDLSHYDLIIDTTKASPAEVAEKIYEGYLAYQNGTFKTAAYVCPSRFFLPKVRPMDGGDGVIRAFEADGDFYIVSGFQTYADALERGDVFAPVTLVKKDS